MTEKDIQYTVVTSPWVFKRFDVVIPNCYTRWENEADLFAIRGSGFCDEYEIKVTKSDFRNDKKKTVNLLNEHATGWKDKYIETPKYEAMEQGHMSNYFWYILPEELYEDVKDEIPDFAGVVIVRKGGMNGDVLVAYEKKQPNRLHREKMSEEDKYKQIRKLGFRYWDLRKKNNC